MFRNPLVDGLVVLLIVLLIFGPKRLPLLGRQLGTGLREFKDSITGDGKDDEESRPALTAAQPPAQATPPAAAAEPARRPSDVSAERQS